MTDLRADLEEVLQDRRHKKIGHAQWLEQKLDVLSIVDGHLIRGKDKAYIQQIKEIVGYPTGHYHRFSRWLLQLFRKFTEHGVAKALEQSPKIKGIFEPTLEEGLYRAHYYLLEDGQPVIPKVRREIFHCNVPLLTTDQLLRQFDPDKTLYLGNPNNQQGMSQFKYILCYEKPAVKDK